MERLLKEAGKLPKAMGRKFDISNYADIVDAIHLVQDSMGIAGATAAEAESTIQGSLSAAKAAWKNLVAGIGDENANLDVLIGNFVESVSTAGTNIIPRVEEILTGIGTAMQTLAPIISEQLPVIISSVLPSLLSAGASLVTGLINGIVESLPGLLPTALDAVVTLVDGILEALPKVAEVAINIVTTLADSISEQLPTLIPVAIGAILQLAETLTNPDSLSNMIDSAIKLIKSLADGIIKSLPTLIDKAPVIIGNLVDAIVENLPKMQEAAFELITSLVAGIVTNLPQMLEAAGKIVAKIASGVMALASNILDIGKNIVRGIWNGIVGMGTWIKNKVTGFFSSIVDGVKDTLGIHSPSRVFAGIGENMALGLGEGWASEFGKIKKDVERGLDFGTANVDFASSSVGISTAGMVNGINAGMKQDSVMAPMTFKLVLPDGVELATYLLDPLAAVANANGTPILNPV